MLGESGLKPLLGPVPAESLSGRAGFLEGDEILTVGGDTTPTWGLALTALIEKALVDEDVTLVVRRGTDDEKVLSLHVPRGVADKPEKLRENLGFQLWQPDLAPVIGRVEPGSAADKAGLKPGDHLISMDGQPLGKWQQWVDYVRSKPATPIQLVLEREGVRSKLEVTPAAVDGAGGQVGFIGARPEVPSNLFEAMTVTYRLAPVPALAAAWKRTVDYCLLTLRIMGRMVVGQASVDNLSGPISIAQYAGQSAKLGLVQFLGFLASVSIGLAVLNMLPIPVLDGGHLLFYFIEGVKGRPLSDATQALFQQAGLFVLLLLIALAFYLDIERLLT
jgi:regulator of sigma E protease